MNVHESARLKHMLLAGGFENATNQDGADVIIFQTCSIRDTAARKVLTHINQARELRRKTGGRQTICVVGCLGAQVLENPKILAGKIGKNDIILGTNQSEVLAERLLGEKVDTRFGIDNSITIIHGCENFCAYCIVPYVRGREISRDISEIVDEFKAILSAKPQKSIYLLGQNVNSYRCPRTGAGFVELLDTLCSMDREFQINFLSSHPKDFGAPLVDCIARNEKIERNIHLPIQSGCDKILRLMNRKYTTADIRGKIEYLRAAVPTVHVTTDVICGFPNESESDFAETVAFMREIKFDAAFIFPYSVRSGTAAATMDGQIHEAVRKRRATELIAVQREISGGAV
jgi:tRNA-2-methylthio-N6-dimethylallyladenosine synthase